jgi:uncharacterized protein
MSSEKAELRRPRPTLYGSAQWSAGLERLILFTRFPKSGRVKTRLIPSLGAEGAARLHRRLTLSALRTAEALSLGRGIEIEIQFDGADERAMSHWLGDRFRFCAQQGDDLGARMSAAFDRAFREGARSVVVIGADCPELSVKILEQAFARLRETTAIVGPALDGGYYLLGLARPIPQVFSGPVWGNDTVLAQSCEILQRLGVDFSVLEPLRDIDRPQDAVSWERLDKSGQKDLSQISVIIPALNEALGISATVEATLRGKPEEVIVVDGGSDDGTAKLAQRAGATVLCSGKGRARQLNAGASRAKGQVLLFLHADTLVPTDYCCRIADALGKPGVVAGAFGFAISDSFPGRRLVERTTNFRSRVWQLPYGDQGLFLRRSVFEELGGYADLPIIEDYELVCRLRRCGRVLTLKEAVWTSGRRWKQLGFLRTTLLNKWMILGHRLGWPVEKLAATYRKALVD